MQKFVKKWLTVFANDNDAFIPEVWAKEGLRVLYENLVAAQLVHRDFSNEVANFGDVVNTRRPGKFTTARKTDTDSVETQDASATNVAVPLDQHHHVSFIIKDGEESKGMQSLIATYLEPAFMAVAQGIDEMVLGERYNFIGNLVGQLGSDPTIDTVIETGTKMDENLAPMMGRNMIVSPATRGALLGIDTFHEADKVGDDGTALREGSLGRKFGFQTHMSQNCKTIVAGDTRTGAINKTNGYAAGTTTIDVDGFSAAITNGSWITVAGDMRPQLVTGTTGGATPSDITISPGLNSSVSNNATVTVYDPALINKSGGYDSGYTKTLTIDGLTLPPRTGQMVTVGATSVSAATKYGALSTPTATELLLNRNLAASINNDAVLGLGPAGNWNFGFHRDAIALVTRPLQLPQSNLANSAVENLNGIGVRAVITYDGEAQGHRVTVDLLAGVKTLDTNLGCIMLG